MTGVWDTVETTTLGLRNYVRSSTERLLIAAHTLEDNEDRETPNDYKIREKNERKTVDKKKTIRPCQINFLFSVTCTLAKKLCALNFFIQKLTCRCFLFIIGKKKLFSNISILKIN